MGTPKAAVPCLERLVSDGHEIVAVYTQPDRPAGRGNRLTAPPVKVCALAHGLAVMQPATIRRPFAAEQFRAHRADVAVVVAYGRILPTAFLNAFPNGAVNVHFSLLPKYRGAAPVNWAIVRGETVTGVSTMLMDEGLDTGPVLKQESVAIGPDEPAAELMDRLADTGAGLLSKTLLGLDSIVPAAQNDAEASLAPMMSKEDGRIDWSLPAVEIVRRVRGFQPFPTSYSMLNGKKLTLWRATVVEGAADAEPGTVLIAEGGRLLIACGGGTAVSVEELQHEGKRRMPARDFLNGLPVQKGAKLE